MKGFRIRSKTQSGEVALRDNVSVNKKVFKVTEISRSPLVLEFEVKNLMMKKMLANVPAKEMTKHITSKLAEYGAIEERDYHIKVIM